MKALVTGATGLVGSHLAERLVKNGCEVRVLVRPTSDTSFLKSLGVEFATGDICDPAACRRAVEGVDYVFHCAAMVSDWAKRDEMMKVNVDALRNLLDACVGKPIKRFVMISSLAVLGMGTQKNFDETAPYVHTGDNYNYTKIEAEKLALSYCREKGVPIVVIRPPYIYGERDRQFLPRLVGALKSGVFRYIDHGKNPFSLVSVKNLVDAILLAAESKNAVGQIYHITDGHDVTRKELVETICDILGFKHPKSSVPLGVALFAIPILETIYRILPTSQPPILNRFRMKFMHTYLTFDISKARRELGYNPRDSFKESMREAVEWYEANNK